MTTRAAKLLDWSILLCLAAAVVIDFTGGFDAGVEGMRLRARSPDRPFMLALGLLGLRLVLDRRTPAPDWLRATWRWVQRHTVDDEAVHAGPVTPSVAAWKHHVPAAIGIAAFGAVMLRAQLTQMDAVTDFGDPLFSIWRFSWVFHQLAGDSRGLFDANIFYPAHLALTFSDSMLLPSLLTAPLLFGGLHPVAAYNTMVVASFGLSAFACYWLCRSLTGSSAAGFIGGLIFGFYPFRFEHYHHFELLMTWWIPLATWGVHRFIATAHALRRGSIRVHRRTALLVDVSGGVLPVDRRGGRAGAHRPGSARLAIVCPRRTGRRGYPDRAGAAADTRLCQRPPERASVRRGFQLQR
jgi:hypothetical protein